MNYKEFKQKYLKEPVVEYPNNRQDKTPLATVKVVTYNHVGFIKECLDSILMQKTNFDFEILIAEDDSNDGTREICIEYANKQPDKIKLLLNSRKNNILINGKPSGNFNNTYANFNIHSKYVAVIEGDDYWTDENSLQKRVEFLENNNDFVMCYHNAQTYFEEEKKLSEKKLVSFTESTVLQKNDILKNATPTLSILYRNGLIEVFEEESLSITIGDIILKAKLSQFGKAQYLHDIKPGIYRIHKGGIYSLQSIKIKIKISLQAFTYLEQYFERKNWNLEPIHKGYASLYFRFFIMSMKGSKQLKISYLFKSYYYSKKSNTSFKSFFIEFYKNRKK